MCIMTMDGQERSESRLELAFCYVTRKLLNVSIVAILKLHVNPLVKTMVSRK